MNLTIEEQDLAYDEVCNSCDLATRNSSDGGKIPCNNHKSLFMQHKYPVITHDLWDGEWTHTWIDNDRIYSLMEGILEEFSESDLTVTEYLHKLNPKVIYQTKEEYGEIPEL